MQTVTVSTDRLSKVLHELDMWGTKAMRTYTSIPISGSDCAAMPKRVFNRYKQREIKEFVTKEWERSQWKFVRI
jgi:hypothetical protein